MKKSPIKGVMRFDKSRNLSLRYVGPFEVLNKIGEVTYQLALRPNLTTAHVVFYIWMLRNTFFILPTK